MRTWTERQAADFLHAVAEDRLSGHVSTPSTVSTVRGPGAVLFRYRYISAKTITIQRACVKDHRIWGRGGRSNDWIGRRTLPLDNALAGRPALPQARQAREHLEAGEAYSRPAPVRLS